MKSKMKEMAVIGLVLSMFFCGCKSVKSKADAVNTKYSTPVSAVCYLYGRGISADGMIYKKNCFDYYVDFETREHYGMCSRINCPHRMLTAEESANGMELCMAFDRDSDYVFMHNGNKYSIFRNKSGEYELDVAQWDGSEKRKLCELEGFSSDAIYVCGNTLWCIRFYEDMITENDDYLLQTRVFPYTVNLETGAAIKPDINWIDGIVSITYCDEDQMQLLVKFVDWKAVNDGNNKFTENDINGNSKVEFWRIQKDGKIERLGEDVINGFYSVDNSAPNRAICIDKNQKDRDAAQFYLWNYETGERKPLENSMVPFFMTETEDYIYLWDEEESLIGMVIRNVVTGEERRCIFPKEESFAQIIGDKVIFNAYNEDNADANSSDELNRIIRVYTLDDLIKGEYQNFSEAEGHIWDIFE